MSTGKVNWFFEPLGLSQPVLVGKKEMLSFSNLHYNYTGKYFCYGATRAGQPFLSEFVLIVHGKYLVRSTTTLLAVSLRYVKPPTPLTETIIL